MGSLNTAERSYLKALTGERFKFMYGDAHGLGYLLDPRYLGEDMEDSLKTELELSIFNERNGEATAESLARALSSKNINSFVRQR